MVYAVSQNHVRTRKLLQSSGLVKLLVVILKTKLLPFSCLDELNLDSDLLQISVGDQNPDQDHHLDPLKKQAAACSCPVCPHTS